MRNENGQAAIAFDRQRISYGGVVGFGRMGLVDDCFIQATDETIVLFGCRQLLDIIIEVIKHTCAWLAFDFQYIDCRADHFLY